MTLLWAGLIILGVAAVAIGAMLLVRRTAPEGSYFQDGDRASGVFGVLRSSDRPSRPSHHDRSQGAFRRASAQLPPARR